MKMPWRKVPEIRAVLEGSKADIASIEALGESGTHPVETHRYAGREDWQGARGIRQLEKERSFAEQEGGRKES